jgi:lysophospholipase L1-like esterase
LVFTRFVTLISLKTFLKLAYNRALTDTELVQVTQYLSTKYSTTARTVPAMPDPRLSLPQIVFDGDSMTDGHQSTNELNYPNQTITLLGGTSNYSYINLGIGGQTVAAMTTDAVSEVDSLLQYGSNRPYNFVVLMGGTNDLGQPATGLVDATTTYNRIVTYAQGRRNAGFKVIVNTILPRSAAGTPADFETSRQTVNSNIRSNWPTFADGIADIASDSIIGPAGASDNTTYYPDKVHMSNTGYGIVASYVAAAINSITHPTASTIGTPTVLSSSAIRWNFTDNANNEIGFRVYTNVDAITTSSAIANLTYLDETGLSENTQYTRYVKAYNSYGESASSSATSTYTLINVPTGFSFNTITTNSITMSASGALPNLASSTSGVYFNETSGNSGGSDSSWQQTTSFQDSGLSENTQYTYRVKARNGNSAETSYAATSSKYTLADTPTGFNFMKHPSSLDIYVDEFPNSNSGLSGYLFWRTDNSSYNSGWIQTNNWQGANTVEGQAYTYGVKYRNGDGVETATTTMGGVSFVPDNGGGGTPTIQPQIATTTATTTLATSTQANTSTSSVQATSTLQFLSGQATPNLAGLTGQAKQVAIQQIKAQIVVIQQKLLILISQLIQLLQEQIRVQLQAR